MATTDRRVALADKKLLGLTELGTRGLSYQLKQTRDALAAVIRSAALFTAVTLSSGGTDRVTASTVYGTNGLGMVANRAGGSTELTALYFENAVTIPYHVGAMLADVPTDVETNARTGLAQYTDLQEVIGWTGTPNAIVDNGNGTLTITVTSVTESGVTNAGRKIRVWLVTPATGVAADAFEELTVVYSGGANKITTAGLLGQSVASTTAADYVVQLVGPRISRNTDLSGVANCIYFGTVTGAGSGVAPSTFVTTGQLLVPSSAALSSDVLELDAHGKWRICVRADASDNKTPQVSVKDSAGTRQIWIDEAGRLHHALEPGGAAGPTLGGASTGSANTTQDNQLDTLLPANLFGSINRVADTQRILGYQLSNAILSGAAPTIGSGLNIEIAASVVLSAGKLQNYGATTLGVSDGITRFVVWNGSAFTVVASPSDTEIPIARFTTSGGSITALSDCRLLPADLDRCVDLSVGGPGAHFATLKAAVDFVNAMAAVGTDKGNRSWRIFVRGNTTETTTIVFYTDNVSIFGVGPHTNGGIGGSSQDVARITWSGNIALFDLGGRSGLTFRDLALHYDATSATSTATISRVAFDDSSVGGPTNALIDRVRVAASTGNRMHGYIRSSGGGTWNECRIVDCHFEDAAEFGINLELQRSWIQRCVFDQTSAASQDATNGFLGAIIVVGPASVAKVWITDCEFVTIKNKAIDIDGGGVQVTGCSIWQFTKEGSGVTEWVGINIRSTAYSYVIRDNQIDNIGGTSSVNATGIRTAGGVGHIMSNDIDVAAPTATETAIDLTGSSVGVRVDGNVLSGGLLTIAGGPHYIGLMNA